MTGFCILDITLYLDTHPEDEEALEYFNYYNTMRNQAMKDYNDNFGPLVLENFQPENKWCWALQPWPWEGGK